MTSLTVDFAFLRVILTYRYDNTDFIYVVANYLDPALATVEPLWKLPQALVYIYDTRVHAMYGHKVTSIDPRRVAASTLVESAKKLENGFEMFHRNPYVTMFY